ncbi:hypothetical protein F5I97DRAFT_100403 [Phlebopus sp. FC_14]|nr:hypothetical protein F5I97DRAFT_100403 [Phlebopus sp. FC_14]
MPREARAPFNTNRADVVLRSSDDIYFRVHSCILGFSSPFFDSMFDLPRPRTRDGDQDVWDGLDVIQVTEDGQILDMLLRFCYPAAVEDPRLETTEELEAVLEAAVKYAMEEVEEKLRAALLDPKFLETEPLRIFSIAYRFRFEAEARAAATCLLRTPTAPFHSSPLKEIDDSDLEKLAIYRSNCAEAVRALGRNLATLHRKQSYAFYKWWTNFCSCPQRPDARYLMHGTYAREWWADYLDETIAALQETPCGRAVMQHVPKALQMATSCPSCQSKAPVHMADFSRSFAQEIDQAIACVPLGMTF